MSSESGAPIFYALPAVDLLVGMVTADGQDIVGVTADEEGWVLVTVHWWDGDTDDEPETVLYAPGDWADLMVDQDAAVDGSTLPRAHFCSEELCVLPDAPHPSPPAAERNVSVGSPTVSAVVVRADAARIPLPDASVDLVVTSPPYFGLRSYRDGGEHYDGQVGAEPTRGEYLDALIRCTAEWVRVLKPGGSIFVNLGDKYGRGTRTTVSGSNSKQGHADPGRVVPTGSPKSLLLIPERYRIACVDQLGLTVRAVVVWDKTNPVPESARDRVSRVHEDWVHLTLSPNYYSSVHEIHTGPRWPGSVWRTPTGAGEARPPRDLAVPHFAPFPMEWPRRLIAGWCPPDGVVLDPFGGTGTTALVASVMGRRGISVDLSADYCRLARWRINDLAQRAKAAGRSAARTELAAERAGQLGMFEVLSA